MQKINFQNLPDTTTPVNNTNLNLLQDNVEDVFDGEEAAGNMVVDSIRSKNLFNENEILIAEGWTKNSSGYYTGTNQNLRSFFQTLSFDGMFEANTQYTFQWTGYLGTANNVRFDIEVKLKNLNKI